MKKIKTFAPIYLLGIVICAVIAVVSFFVGVKPLLKLNNIIKNGTEATAYVEKGIKSNTTINDEPTWFLEVVYTDKDGNEVRGTTIDYFSTEYAQSVLDTEITIRYIGTDIIHSTSLFDTAGITSIVFSIAAIVMGVLALFLIAMFAKAVVTAAALNGLLTTGYQVTGRYIETGKSFMMGHTKYYSVTYEYKNASGETVRKNSPRNYTEGEAAALKEAGEFEVRMSGNKSIIAYEFN